jgi:mono/diheme cytochrome c family protein
MKTRNAWLSVVVILLLIALCAGFAISRASISALDEPGRLETVLATRAKHVIVAHQTAKMHIAEIPTSPAGTNAGQILFSVECASCHGKDGRSPTHIGQSMYPRVPDLGSPEVQEWSDPELFWIIQHGIRLSGMPGFQKFDTDEQLWFLVHYIRTLPNQPKR